MGRNRHIEARRDTLVVSGLSCFPASPVLLAHPYGISNLELRAADAHGGAAGAGQLLRRLEELLAPMARFGISPGPGPRCGLDQARPVLTRLDPAGGAGTRAEPGASLAEPGASLSRRSRCIWRTTWQCLHASEGHGVCRPLSSWRGPSGPRPCERGGGHCVRWLFHARWSLLL